MKNVIDIHRISGGIKYSILLNVSRRFCGNLNIFHGDINETVIRSHFNTVY